MIQSAWAITAWWCSITMTDFAGVDQPVQESENLLDVGQVQAGRGLPRTPHLLPRCVASSAADARRRTTS